MKPAFHKVPVQQSESFSVRHDIKPNFGTVWHYHPELELHYVIRGEGIRFIGDDISNFTAGEMVLLGANLPHTWRCQQEYFQKNSNKETEAIVIQFLPECFGKSFLSLPEAWQLNGLLERASKGLLIKGRSREQLKELMNKTVQTEGLPRILNLLCILEILAVSDECEAIATAYTFPFVRSIDYGRLNKIYNYTFTNFHQKIDLDTISSVCSVSPTYFCRFFKKTTGKTYHDFLTEVRISNACRMLLEGDSTVEEVCYTNGFNNLTNFFRYFRKLKGITPAVYRARFAL